jgi:hypothetical protein
MNNVVNKVAYLPTSRIFPEDLPELSIEVNRSYIDIANAVNNRTISIFPVNVPALTGESWYVNNGRQQTFREVYQFGAISAGTELDIPTNITGFVRFTRMYGNVITTNGSSGLPDYRPLPYVDPGTLSTSMSILVGIIAGKQQIRIVLGSTAVPVTSGIAVLEWMVQP